MSHLPADIHRRLTGETIMKVTSNTVKEIVLILTEEEAIWLKDRLQNPLITSESQEDFDIRTDFFTELRKAIAD